LSGFPHALVEIPRRWVAETCRINEGVRTSTPPRGRDGAIWHRRIQQ
jgi:hypothetical protein